jgi:hypothetical protein
MFEFDAECCDVWHQVVSPNYKFPPQSRSQHLTSLAATPEYDVIVIGGGATGCGLQFEVFTQLDSVADVCPCPVFQVSHLMRLCVVCALVCWNEMTLLRERHRAAPSSSTAVCATSRRPS